MEIVRFYVDQAWHGRGSPSTHGRGDERRPRGGRPNALARRLGAEPRAIASTASAGFRDAGTQMSVPGEDRQRDSGRAPLRRN